MEKFEYQLILKLIPVVIFIGYLITPRKRKILGIAQVPFFPVLLMVVVYIFMMGLYPLDWTFDRPRYRNIYVWIHTYIYDWKDNGWIVYNRFLKPVFGDFWQGMFLVTSTLYCLFYCIFAKRTFTLKFAPYFLILTFSAMGFVNYGTNVLRGGLSIALLFYAVSEKRVALKIVATIVALSFQQFGIILLGGYIVGRLIKKNYLFEYLWIICLIASFINLIDLSYFAEVLDITDTRALGYLESDNESYQTGFRMDFVAYSLFPLIIAYYYIRHLSVNDIFYTIVYRTYLAINSLWLLAIRMPYTDRVAYYSWCLIPFLVLYPLLITPQNIPSPQRKLNALIIFYLIVGFAI